MSSRLYRADIDGLRAIAVGLVVAFHLDIDAVSGGFVGVDVFFVISGYLITTIILDELKTQRFSIWRFYERRIRRIFPALFVMITLTTIAAFALLLPIDFKNFGQSVTAATLFASNILFLFEAGYFDTDAELKPLLHTWSLAVEEQFYVLFPLAMMLIWRFAPKSLFSAIIISALISFLGAEFSVRDDPSKTFFLSPFRFWELLTGALLAFKRLPDLPATMATIASWIGLLALVAAATLFDPRTPFPGAAALLPCLGAALLIHAGNAGQDSISMRSANHLLARPSLVFVGLLSYSLYLWHWPLIVFYRYVSIDELNAIEQTALALASFVAAYLSWRFVEQPFRHAKLGQAGKSYQLRQAFLAGGSAMFLTSAVGIWIAFAQGMPWRVDPTIATIERDELYVNYLQDCRPKELRLDDLCIRGTLEVEPSFLLLGDSHAGSIAPGVFQAAHQSNEAGVQLTVPSYRPFLDFGRQGFEELDRQVDQRLVHILETMPHLRTIIIVAHWRQAIDLGYTDAVSGELVLESLLDVGMRNLISRFPTRHFVVIQDFPIDHRFGANRCARQIAFGHEPDKSIPRYAHEAAIAESSSQLERLGTHSHVTSRHLNDIFCDQQNCFAVENNRSLYRDADHLSLTGALKTVPFFKSVFKNHKARAANSTH